MQLELMLGDGDDDRRIDPLSEVGHQLLASHFHAIAGPQVLDKPVSLLDFHQAVITGHITEIQHDIVAVSAADAEPFFQERNGISASQGDKFAKHGDFTFNEIKLKI